MLKQLEMLMLNVCLVKEKLNLEKTNNYDCEGKQSLLTICEGIKGEKKKIKV